MSVIAVLLDLDGLLADTEPLQVEALRAAVAHFGVSLPDDYVAARIVGTSDGQNALDIVADFALTVEPDTIVERKDREFARIAATREIAAMPGAWEFMRRVRPRAARLALVSSSKQDAVNAVLAGLRSPGERDSLADWFDLIVTGRDVAAAKPAPDIYRRALSTLREAPESCVAVEDSAAGVAAARGAGIQCLAVPNALTGGQNFDGAWHICRSLGDAASVIESLLPAEAPPHCRGG